MASNKNNVVPLNSATQGQGNLTLIAHNLDLPIRAYTSLNLYNFNLGIAYLVFGENAHFEVKPVMLQMIQKAGQFDGYQGEDPHEHIKSFYSICASFHMSNFS